MHKKLGKFIKATEAMLHELYSIDKDESPVLWIQKKLRIMAHIDQATRGFSGVKLAGAINKHYRGAFRRYDHRSTAELKEILDMPAVTQAGGWLSQDIFGAKASADAWLIAQHADKDKDFQVKALSLITPFFHAGEINPNDYAYLYDRVQVFCLDRPQRFGSQGSQMTNNEPWRPWPCENAEGKLATSFNDVDVEAIKIGMTFKDGSQWTLTEYFKKWNGDQEAPSFLPLDHPKFESL